MTSKAIVPNRLFRIDVDGACIGAIGSMDLWAWPELLIILQPRLVWDFNNDTEVFEQMGFKEKTITDIFNHKCDNNDLTMFDLQWVLERNQSLWTYWTVNVQQLKDRLDQTLEYLWDERDHPQLPRLIGILWDIFRSSDPFVNKGTDFWKVMYNLWTYRFRDDSGPLYRINRFDADDIIDRFQKMDLLHA